MPITRYKIVLTMWVLLIASCLTSASCAGLGTRKAYEGPKRPDTETARVQVVRSQDEKTESCIGAVDKMDWGGSPDTVLVLPGRHEFYVVTAHVTGTDMQTPIYGPYYTTYRFRSYVTKQAWKVTFDVATGSKYRIVPRKVMSGPPQVFICDATGKDTEIVATAEPWQHKD